ncbi:unnamed protein product [Lampetra planeri]
MKVQTPVLSQGSKGDSVSSQWDTGLGRGPGTRAWAPAEQRAQVASSQGSRDAALECAALSGLYIHAQHSSPECLYREPLTSFPALSSQRQQCACSRATSSLESHRFPESRRAPARGGGGAHPPPGRHRRCPPRPASPFHLRKQRAVGNSHFQDAPHRCVHKCKLAALMRLETQSPHACRLTMRRSLHHSARSSADSRFLVALLKLLPRSPLP